MGRLHGDQKGHCYIGGEWRVMPFGSIHGLLSENKSRLLTLDSDKPIHVLHYR